jgi:hypothetical protein
MVRTPIWILVQNNISSKSYSQLLGLAIKIILQQGLQCTDQDLLMLETLTPYVTRIVQGSWNQPKSHYGYDTCCC